ncbi:MAG TPA: DUF2461 domain-containing protein [Ignavibacteria bacterium]|jgi:uncharacterized protein (TIGR02453 family)
MLKKSTLDFLKKLKKNNNRDWFNANKHLYEDARYDFEVLVFDIIQKIAEYDESVSGVDPKSCLFRIYRDVRFSKNKSPYKTNLAADIQQGGRKSNFAGYYFHVEPDSCMLAGGIYMPPPDKLLAIRRFIADSYKEFEKIVRAKDFKKEFKQLWQGEDKLKTIPKGFEKEHPAADYLKNKSFIVIQELDDVKILSNKFVYQAAKVFKTMKPFNDFLNRAVTFPV